MPATPIIRKPSLGPPPARARRAYPLPARAVLVLRVAVAALVWWHEYAVFWRAARRCTFDDVPLKDAKDEGHETEEQKAFRVLVLSDPQLLDLRSYPGRSYILRQLGVIVTDAYARKSWAFVSKAKGKKGGTDAVVWLGDLLDSGVEGFDRKEHSHYVHRFHLLFPLPRLLSSQSGHSHLSPPVPSIFMPGNHDLGLHLPSSSLASYARERFQDSFGETRGEKEWGGWSVVWIDSMALLEPGQEGEDAKAWVDHLAARKNDLPRVLLTHIPLWRPEGTSCGPGREARRPIRQGQGRNYQNEMDQEISAWLLEKLKPSLVLSGDDHDLCELTHDFASPSSLITQIPETTVKAFSMAMGVRKPGYHLLTLFPPPRDSPSAAAQPARFTQRNCELPDQIGIWLDVYLPAAALLVALLLAPKLVVLWRSSRSRSGRRTQARGNGLPVHTGHQKSRSSLSRKLFAQGGGLGDDQEEVADEDAQFPTFLYSPAGGGVSNGGYAYHAGLDGEELPTPATAGFPRDEGGGHVRRVSRVWLWERGGGGGAGGSSPGGLPYGRDDDRRGSGLMNSLDYLFSSASGRQGGALGGVPLPYPLSHGGSSDFLPSMPFLGPLNRVLIRPVNRLLRAGFHRFPGPQLGWALKGVTASPVVRELVDELGRIVGVGLAVAIAVWLWFLL